MNKGPYATCGLLVFLLFTLLLVTVLLLATIVLLKDAAWRDWSNGGTYTRNAEALLGRLRVTSVSHRACIASVTQITGPVCDVSVAGAYIGGLTQMTGVRYSISPLMGLTG